jgi:hypothetical protein
MMKSKHLRLLLSLLLPAFLFVILRCYCLLFCLSFRSAAEESAVSRRRYGFVSRLHEQHSRETRSSTHHSRNISIRVIVQIGVKPTLAIPTRPNPYFCDTLTVFNL